MKGDSKSKQLTLGTLRPALRLINTAGFSPVYQRPHASQPFQRLPDASPNLLCFH